MTELFDICQLVWNEYDLLISTYEGFNDFSFTLKGWSVTVSLAAIFAVYIEKLGLQGKAILWSAALCAVPFWGLDALWKLYQQAYLHRIDYLEGLSNCAAAQPHNFGINASWRAAFQEMRYSPIAWASAIFRTAFPHFFILALGMILAVRFPPGHTKETG